MAREIACRICQRPMGPGDASHKRGVCNACASTRRGPATKGRGHRRDTGVHLEEPAAEGAADPFASILPAQELPVPGSPLGGLVVEGRLGEGGMGTLFVARDPRLERRVAVKFLRTNLVDRARAERFFLREGRALAGLHHANVVRVYTEGRWRGSPYLVMELVEGTPLSDRVKAGPMPVAEVLRFAEEIADALAAVHAANIAHRDVKPDNIMIRSRNGSACLVDFGLARGLDGASASSGVPMGTLCYSAPEQATGRGADHRVDIYAFGATLFEALTGRCPHEGAESGEYLHSLLHRDAPLLRSLRGDAPPGLEILVARALSRAPELRQRDGSALLEEVRRVRREVEGPAAPPADRVAEGAPAAPQVPSRDPSESLPLLGRSAEYGALVGALDDVAGRRGRVLLVEGGPGSGKSRIVRELERAARSRAFGVIRCAGSEFSGSLHRALREGIIEHARTLGAGSPGEVVALMAAAAPANGALAPALRWFLSPGTDEGPGNSVLVRAVLALLRALLGERPVLLVAEDAHLLDEGSLDLLAAAAEEGGAWPLCLAFSFRPPDAVPARAPLVSRLPRLRGIPAAVGVVLGPLSESAVATMIHLALRVDEAEACQLAPILHRKSSGNPLFLVESLRLLEQERGADGPDRHLRIRERLSRLAIPPRLLGLATLRISGLPKAEREALGVASIDARGVPSGLVAQCLGFSKLRALRTLQQLVKTRGLLLQNGDLYQVQHGEVREAAYGELIAELRAEYHAKAARSLELSGAALTDPARLGRHIARSGEAARAVPHLVEAGRRLLAGHSPADALDHFEEALRCAGEAGCPAAAAGRAQALEKLGDHEAARAALERMMGAGGEAAAEALLPLAEFERDRGNHRGVLELLARVPAGSLPPENRIRHCLLEAQAHSKIGGEEAALAALERAAALADLVPRARVLELWNTQGTVRWRLGRLEEALEWLEKALRLSEESGVLDRTEIVLYNMGLVCSDLGRQEEGLSWTRKAIDRGILLGSVRSVVYSRLLLADLLLESGSLAEAEAVLDTVAGEVDRLDSSDARSYLASGRADLAFAQGRYAESLEWAGRSMADATGGPGRTADLRSQRAAALLELGRREEALEEARRARAAFGAGSTDPSADDALSFAARALRELGIDGPERAELRGLLDTPSACAAAERAAEEADPAGREAWLAKARALATELRHGDYALRRVAAVGGAARG